MKRFLMLMLLTLGIENLVLAGTPFADHGNQTMTDLATGLMWDQRETTTMTWTAALSYCESLNHGGQTDWRLPNRNELESLVDDSIFSAPTINTTYFPGAVWFRYWSSTTDLKRTYAVFIVDFGYGDVNFNSKTNNNYVRCVR